MNQDDWDAMWGDEPRSRDGCLLLATVFVIVWAVIIVGVSWLVSR